MLIKISIKNVNLSSNICFVSKKEYLCARIQDKTTKKMKKIFSLIVVLVSVLAVSCKKENAVTPQNSTATKKLAVEYRITSESGAVEISYLKPNAEGKFELETETVKRTNYSINFEAQSGNTFMIEAYNVLPSRKAVHVQIYINGKLIKEAFSYDPSQKAIAQCNY